MSAARSSQISSRSAGRRRCGSAARVERRLFVPRALKEADEVQLLSAPGPWHHRLQDFLAGEHKTWRLLAAEALVMSLSALTSAAVASTTATPLEAASDPAAASVMAADVPPCSAVAPAEPPTTLAAVTHPAPFVYTPPAGAPPPPSTLSLPQLPQRTAPALARDGPQEDSPHSSADTARATAAQGAAVRTRSSSEASTSTAAPAAQHFRGWVQAFLGGDGRDRAVDVLKGLDNRLDNALSGVGARVMGALSPAVPADGDEAQRARALVQEAVELIDQRWLDARGIGLQRARWKEACLRELEARPPRSMTQAHLTIKAFLGQGPADPYTRFVAADDFQKLVQYDVSGIGMNLASAADYVAKVGPLPRSRGVDDGGVWVVGLIKGLAAERGGVVQGDELLAVDETDVSRRPPFDAASLIARPLPPRGGSGQLGRSALRQTASVLAVDAPAAGAAAAPEAASADAATRVRLRLRGVDGKTRTVEMERARSREVTNPVKYRLRTLSNGARKVGYVALSAFNARAAPELRAAVTELKAQGATELVLDLSDNFGGLVSESVEVASMFLPSGATVYITQGVSTNTPTLTPPSTEARETLPLTVMVNGSTASAAEIVAGALKDNCRATVAGKPTFGKGLVQSVYQLSDSSGMIVTVGKYLTASGKDIDRRGITPDVRSLPTPAEAAQQQQQCILRSAT